MFLFSKFCHDVQIYEEKFLSEDGETSASMNSREEKKIIERLALVLGS
jgi:hypothetical protein